MAYIDIAYMKLRLPPNTIELLTDDKKTGAVNTNNLNACITDAQDDVDTRLSIKYAVPFDSPIDMIKRYTFNLAKYYLYDRYIKNEMPKHILDTYKNTISELELIGSGAKDLPGVAKKTVTITDKIMVTNHTTDDLVLNDLDNI